MAFDIIDTPARNVSLYNVSRWGAAFNPQVFFYQRKDFEISILEPDGLDLSLIIDVSMSDEDLLKIIDTYVYVKTATRDYLAKVLGTYSDVSATVLTIETDGTVTSEFDGFVNIPALYPSYKFKTTIKAVGEIDIISRHTPDAKGLCRVDLQVYLKTLTNSTDNIDYSFLTSVDNDRFIKYKTVIIEELSSEEEGETKTPATEYYTTHSALNFNPLGSNMGANVAFLNEPEDAKKAKFMTNAAQPILNIGMPFDLAFIVDDSLEGVQLYCRYATLDVNKNDVYGGLTPSVIYMSAGNPAAISPYGLLLATNELATGFTIETAVGVNRFVFLDSLLDTVKYIQIYLYYIDGSTEKRVTEVKTIEVKNNCINTGFVYLKWLNTKGGWDYELFDNRNEHALDVLSQTFIDRSILNYSTENTTQDVLSKSAQEKIIVGKNGLNKDQMQRLSGMLYSSKVYMLTNSNPLTWQTVVVDDKGTALYDTKNNFGDFQTTIKLPEINIQTA